MACLALATGLTSLGSDLSLSSLSIAVQCYPSRPVHSGGLLARTISHRVPRDCSWSHLSLGSDLSLLSLSIAVQC
jgi:hypothetical protein